MSTKSDKLVKGITKENILMAFSNLQANKFRSFLTTLGIVIGVMTVVVIASILTGMRQNIITLIEEYGTSNIWAFHLTTGPQLGPRDRKEWTRKPLKPEDAEAIRQQAPAVEDVALTSYVWWVDHTLTYGGETYKRGNLQAVSANYGPISNSVMEQGRFISELESGQLPTALDQVEAVLRRQRNVRFNEPNNFDLSTSEKFIKQFDSITAAIGIIAIAISGVGLMVGGIGVMNIMLVSVTERTREIGVRKAIGARRKDIVTQFLFEAMTLTSLGGIIGIILSILISFLLLILLPDLPAKIPLWAVITGLTVSTAVGLVFGVWPARVASRLDPIECLRYE